MSNDPVLDCAVVGFELTDDPLLEGEFVPLKQGLTVLYGLNGAGKTRLLRGIRAAVTGVRDEVDLGMIVSAVQGKTSQGWSGGNGDRRPFAIAIAQTIAATGVDPLISDLRGYDDYGTSPAERQLDLSRASEVIDNYISAMAGDEDPDLTVELRESRLFLLIPTGTREHPSWDAWAVSDVERPAASHALSVLTQQLRDFEDDSSDDRDDWFDAFADWEERARPRALFSPDHMPPFARRRPRGVRPNRFQPYLADAINAEFIRGLEIGGEIDFGIELMDSDGDPDVVTQRHFASIVDALERHDHESESDIFTATSEAFSATGERRRKAGEPTSQALSDLVESSVATMASELSRLATAYLERALPQAPEAMLCVSPPALRFSRSALEWTFTRAGVSLNDLSRAERQWAIRAINHAVSHHRRELFPQGASLRPTLWLVDEPEAALHRAAEDQMATFMVELAENPQSVIFAASHSPELLDAPKAHVVEVERGGGKRPGRSSVHALDLSKRSSLSQLGLTPSDLLRWTRVFLLVEGVHDEAVLRAFLGDRLRKARVEIITLSGSKNLKKTLESDVLYKFTRAKVVALLDNIRMSEVTPVWHEAVQLAVSDGPQRGADYIFKALPKIDETGALRSWLGSALSRGYHNRVEPFGLQRRDVLEYLPASAFTGRSESWDELRTLRAVKDGIGLESGRLKEWTSSHFGVDFGGAAVEVAIAAAVPRLEVPEEFLELMTMLESPGASNAAV